MKKILISTLVASAVILSACEDNLDIPQKGVTPLENFYNSDSDAEEALTSAYTGFIWNVCGYEGGSIYVPTYQASVQCGDDLFAAGSELGDNDHIYSLNEFRYDAGNATIENAYQNYYYAMYYSNLVIDHFADKTSSVAKRCVAEARVLRAYMHMMLALGWENPPKVDHVLDGGATPANCPHDELLQWCAEECEAAVADLEERSSKTDKAGAIRVTKGFAWGVAGKCYLYMDSPNYEKAKENLKKVITSDKYALVPGTRYEENFHVEGDCNEEKIFEANVAHNGNVGDWSGNIQRTTWMQTNLWGWRSDRFVYRVNQNEYSSLEGWGGCGVPKSFADEFVANDGVDSYRLKASIISIEDLMYGKLMVWKPIQGKSLDEIKQSKEIGLTEIGLYGQSKYLMLKKNVRTNDLASSGVNQSMINHCIMRYAEVLLMYAEACLQTGDNAEAKKYINMIQERAGSKTISATVDMNVLKREKKLEMWLEGCRWYDMRRWNDYDLAKKAGMEVTTLYDKLTRPIKAGDKVAEDGDRFYTIYNDEHKVKNVTVQGYSDKFKYFPFPTSVISKNPNLVQHEGW